MDGFELFPGKLSFYNSPFHFGWIFRTLVCKAIKLLYYTHLHWPFTDRYAKSQALNLAAYATQCLVELHSSWLFFQDHIRLPEEKVYFENEKNIVELLLSGELCSRRLWVLIDHLQKLTAKSSTRFDRITFIFITRLVIVELKNFGRVGVLPFHCALGIIRKENYCLMRTDLITKKSIESLFEFEERRLFWSGPVDLLTSHRHYARYEGDLEEEEAPEKTEC